MDLRPVRSRFHIPPLPVMMMIIWYNVEASCPVCGHRLQLRELGGGFAVGDNGLVLRYVPPSAPARARQGERTE